MWTLPVSRTGPNARSCKRRKGCLCAHLCEAVCPSLVHVEVREYFTGSLWSPLCCDRLEPGVPRLFGQGGGQTCQVKAIEKNVVLKGERCYDAAGRRLFGGHSCRMAGSRSWMAQGLEFMWLQIFACRRSQVILRFVAVAPLESAICFSRQQSTVCFRI